MLPEDEWKSKPDMVSVLKPMIMNHLNNKKKRCIAEQIVEDMELLDHVLFRDEEPTDVLKGVKDALRVLEEDGQLQSTRVDFGVSTKWFYRPVSRNTDM